MANRRDIQRALENRLELVKAGLTRRDLMKMGLMSGAGVLIPKGGLTHAHSTRGRFSYYHGCYSGCDVGCSPQPSRVFVDPMPIPPVLPSRPLTDPGLTFGAPPQICPTT